MVWKKMMFHSFGKSVSTDSRSFPIKSGRLLQIVDRCRCFARSFYEW